MYDMHLSLFLSLSLSLYIYIYIIGKNKANAQQNSRTRDNAKQIPRYNVGMAIITQHNNIETLYVQTTYNTPGHVKTWLE